MTNVESMVENVRARHRDAVQNYIRLFLADTGLCARDVVLCQADDGSAVRYWCEARSDVEAFHGATAGVGGVGLVEESERTDAVRRRDEARELLGRVHHLVDQNPTLRDWTQALLDANSHLTRENERLDRENRSLRYRHE